MSEETRMALLRDYQRGVPTAEIAKSYGVSESYPSQLAARYNVKRRHSNNTKRRAMELSGRSLADSLGADIAKPDGPPPMHVKTVAEIRRLAGMGRRRTEIAALLRCPYREVDEALA